MPVTLPEAPLCDDVVEEVATRIWNFDGDGVEDFKGPYADFVTQKESATA